MTTANHNPHRITLRIYYEDTDAGGVVYYANYLKFAERARTEWLRDQGFEQQSLARQADPVLFVVSKASMELKKPAFLDDCITIETTIHDRRGARLTFAQRITRGETLLANLLVEIAAVTPEFKPRKLPEGLG